MLRKPASPVCFLPPAAMSAARGRTEEEGGNALPAKMTFSANIVVLLNERSVQIGPTGER